MLSQLLALFGFFSLVLVLVYWVNRAVVLFDRLIANGHSAWVFVEFTALTLPNVIRLVLPVSAFAAAVYVAQRQRADSELVVVQATGFSPWRLARPALAFGAVVALAVSVLAHLAAPASLRALSERTAEIAQDVTAGLLTPGTFLHPGDGITFYIRDITVSGELRDIFLSDARRPDRDTVYSAGRAMLVRSQAGPRLLMFDGTVQTLRKADGAEVEDGRMSLTGFDDFAFDIGAIFDMPAAARRRPAEVGTLELLRAPPTLSAETDRPRPALVFEAHERFAQAATALALPGMALSVLLLGGHSRLGGWGRVAAAVLALVAVELVRNAVTGPGRSDVALFWLAYAPALLAAAIAALCLAVASGPGPSLGRSGRARPA